MLRYVILRHITAPGDARASHWDLMLESADGLRTWALEEEPAAGSTIAADELAVHRMAYLEIEGELSGGRGSVTRWDSGCFQARGEDSTRLELVVEGQRLQGRITLERDAPDAQRWRFSFDSEPATLG